MDQSTECEIIHEDDVIPDVTYKIIVIGEASVGKSCIMIRAVKDQYDEEYEVTIGADSSSLLTKVDGKIVELQIWDTAGTEKFRSMIRVFFTNCNGAFIVYDITRKASFEALDFWLKMLKDNTDPTIRIVLIGNKKDKEESRQVTFEMGKDYAEKNQFFGFAETSAKTGEGIIETLKKMSKSLYNDNKNEDSSPKRRLKLNKKIKKEKNCC